MELLKFETYTNRHIVSFVAPAQLQAEAPIVFHSLGGPDFSRRTEFANELQKQFAEDLLVTKSKRYNGNGPETIVFSVTFDKRNVTVIFWYPHEDEFRRSVECCYKKVMIKSTQKEKELVLE